jgi:hypothetical protein
MMDQKVAFAGLACFINDNDRTGNLNQAITLMPSMGITFFLTPKDGKN